MENLTAKQLCDKIAAGEMKSLDAVQEVFARIEKYEPVIGAYITTFKEQALERAVQIDRKISAKEPVGQLAGVPVAVKDNMCTTFGITTCASKITSCARTRTTC